MQRVVITGVGLVSVLGLTREAVAQALYHGKSGIASEPERLEHGFRSPLTGRIEGFDPSVRLGRKQRKTMPLFAVQAYAAAMDAIEQARLSEREVRSPRCGLVFGNDSTVTPAFDLARAMDSADETAQLGSGHVFRTMNSTLSMNLNVLLGNQGGAWTVSAACASGLYAVGQAADGIRMGRHDVVICGAAQEMGRAAVAAFDGLGAFSVNPMPGEASRPFDARRDGLVPSGGAAALVLESYAHAVARGACLLGEVLGFGFSADGHEIAAPSHTGLARAMRMALAEARLAPAEVSCISAHATSTIRGDAAEAANIRTVFGAAGPPVMALKSLTGHEFWMSGAAQVAYGAIMAEWGFTAGTPTFHEPDADTRGVRVLQRTVDEPPRVLLCNAAGFGGSNACLVVRF